MKSEKEDLAAKTTRGMAWSLLSYGVNKGFTIVTLMILARLLTKADFGLIAAAAIVIDLLSSYKDLGLSHALIQKRQDFDSAVDSVFTINLITGAVLSLTVFCTSPLIAAYFESPAITPLLRWLGLSFLINAIGAVHITRLRRQLDYRRKMIPDICSAFSKALVSIFLALSGFGVWSLVAGQLIGALVSSLVAWVVVPWFPRLRINRAVTGGLIRYGTSIMGTNAVSALSDNLSYIIIAKVCGMALLGTFSLSFRLPEVLLIGNLWVLSQVFFPMFALIQTEPEKIKKGFLTTVRLVSLIATPISLGLLIAADPLIRVMYGPQWLDAIPILRILAVYAWVHSFGYHAGDIYKAIGRPHVLLLLSICAAVIDLTALLIASRYGLSGIAFGLLAAMLINCAINLYIAIRLLGVSFFSILLELRSSLIGGMIFSGCAVALSMFTEGMTPFVELSAQIGAGGIGYLSAFWFLEKDNTRFILSKLGLCRG